MFVAAINPRNAKNLNTTQIKLSEDAHLHELDEQMRIFSFCVFLVFIICAILLYNRHMNWKKKRRKDDVFLELEKDDEGEARYVVSFFTGMSYRHAPTGIIRFQLIGTLYPGRFHILNVESGNDDEDTIATSEDGGKQTDRGDDYIDDDLLEDDDAEAPNQKSKRLFPPNCHEKFIIAEDVCLGRITSIIMQTEIYGAHPYWNCETIIVRDLGSNEAWYFRPQCTIGFPPTILEPETVEKLTTFKLSWQRRVHREVRHGQYALFGFWFRPRKSVYTVFQRSVVALACYFNLLCNSIFFFALAFLPNMEIGNEEGGHNSPMAQRHGRHLFASTGRKDLDYWFSHVVIVGIVASIVTSCIGYVLVTLFRQKSKYEKHVKEMDYVIGTALHEFNLMKEKMQKQLEKTGKEKKEQEKQRKMSMTWLKSSAVKTPALPEPAMLQQRFDRWEDVFSDSMGQTSTKANKIHGGKSLPSFTSGEKPKEPTRQYSNFQQFSPKVEAGPTSPKKSEPEQKSINEIFNKVSGSANNENELSKLQGKNEIQNQTSPITSTAIQNGPNKVQDDSSHEEQKPAWSWQNKFTRFNPFSRKEPESLPRLSLERQPSKTEARTSSSLVSKISSIIHRKNSKFNIHADETSPLLNHVEQQPTAAITDHHHQQEQQLLPRRSAIFEPGGEKPKVDDAQAQAHAYPVERFYRRSKQRTPYEQRQEMRRLFETDGDYLLHDHESSDIVIQADDLEETVVCDLNEEGEGPKRKFPHPILGWLAILLVLVLPLAVILIWALPKLTQNPDPSYTPARISNMILSTYAAALLIEIFLVETIKMGLLAIYYAYTDKTIYKKIIRLHQKTKLFKRKKIIIISNK